MYKNIISAQKKNVVNVKEEISVLRTIKKNKNLKTSSTI